MTTPTGRPIRGERVVFAPVKGSGSVTGAVAVTDDDGVASVGAWTLGTVAGRDSLSAIVATATTETRVNFTATATPGSATSLRASVSSLSAAANAFELALARDGTQLYVARPWEGDLVVLDAATLASIRRHQVGAPTRVSFDHAGTTAVVATGGAVAFIR